MSDQLPALSATDFARRSGAAMHTAVTWLGSIFDNDDLASAWPLTDPSFRLAIAQRWILWRSQQPGIIRAFNRDELAAFIAEPVHPPSALWDVFATTLLTGWRAALGPLVTDPDRRGFLVPEVFSLDIEAVRLTDIASQNLTALPDGSFETIDDRIEVQLIFVRHTPDGALVAGVGSIPTPGWPPIQIVPPAE